MYRSDYLMYNPNFFYSQIYTIYVQSQYTGFGQVSGYCLPPTHLPTHTHPYRTIHKKMEIGFRTPDFSQKSVTAIAI